MVRACAQRYPSSPDIADELMQVGYIGLMKAINGFDPQVGSSLPAYAWPCISGEIKRYFRDRRWSVRVYRPAQELRLEIRDATAALTQQLARAPRPAELAEYLHVRGSDHRSPARRAGVPGRVPGCPANQRGRYRLPR